MPLRYAAIIADGALMVLVGPMGWNFELCWFEADARDVPETVEQPAPEMWRVRRPREVHPIAPRRSRALVVVGFRRRPARSGLGSLRPNPGFSRAWRGDPTLKRSIGDTPQPPGPVRRRA